MQFRTPISRNYVEMLATIFIAPQNTTTLPRFQGVSQAIFHPNSALGNARQLWPEYRP